MCMYVGGGVMGGVSVGGMLYDGMLGVSGDGYGVVVL